MGTHVHDHQADDRQLCLVGTREHRAHDGMLVCSHHAQQIATWLRDIEDETALLDPRKSMAISSGGKGGTLASQQAPVRLDALVLTDTRRNAGGLGREQHDPHGLDDTPEALNVLASWAGLVREERQLAIPMRDVVLERWTTVVPGPACWHPPLVACGHPTCAAVGTRAVHVITDSVVEPAYLARERGLLSRQLPWIVQQAWIGDLHTDLHELLDALRRTNGTQDVAAGRCTTLQPNTTECGGTIRHIEIDHPDGPPEPGFRCARCRRVWTGTEAVRLRHQLWLDEQDQAATA